MDFMNFVNQINGLGCGNNCGCDLNQGCNNTGGFRSELLPLILLSGLGQGRQNFSGGNLTCYPNNQCQQFITPTSSNCCGSNIRYRTRRVRQAYMEVPVSTYQVAQPFYGMSQPTTMNIMPVSGNRNGIDLWTILILLFLFNRNNRSSHSHHHGSNNVSSEI